MTDRAPIPRDPANDYTPAMAERRAQFLRERTGVELDHVRRASFDPALLPGNIENFVGVAQVPIGLAGPLRINGEHATGDFYVPLELVAHSEKAFSLRWTAGDVDFDVKPDGSVGGLTFTLGGEKRTATKIE